MSFWCFSVLLSTCVVVPIQPTIPDQLVTPNPFETLTASPFLPGTESPKPLQTTTFAVSLPSSTKIFSNIYQPRSQYFIDAHLDYWSQKLQVFEMIRYINNTNVDLRSLVLAVEPNLWRGCFILENLMVNSQIAETILDGHSLEVLLDDTLEPGEILELSIWYTLNLPATGSSVVFGVKPNQINLVNWYPYIVPYRDGWLLHEPSTVGEYLVYDSVDFMVDFHVIPSMVIAASAEAVDFHYHLEQARTFVLSVSPYYHAVFKNQNGVQVTSYFFEEDKVSGEAVLQESVKALDYFSRTFGNYSHESLTIVEALFVDGMEYDGLFFLGQKFYENNDGTKLNYLIDLTVHETAHQWWFGIIGNDQAIEPWLDEALSTYSEFLFYEEFYPGISDTWWQFRVEKFLPSGFVDTTIYSTDNFQQYASQVYLQGALFLSDIRTRIGDSNFFGFIKDYVMQMGGGIATSTDFFQILAICSGVDISDIVETYFFQGQ